MNHENFIMELITQLEPTEERRGVEMHLNYTTSLNEWQIDNMGDDYPKKDCDLSISRYILNHWDLSE